MKYKSKQSILEARYVGKFPISNDKWFKWKYYRDDKTALEAKQNLERKHKSYLFRLKTAGSKS